MEILSKQTLKNTRVQLTLFLLESPASPSPMLGSNLENQMGDIYGTSTFDAYESACPNGLWQRMFMVCFQQMAEQTLRILPGKWSLSATKFSRYYYHLRLDKSLTLGKGFGLSDVISWKLIPTPREGSWEGYASRAKRKGHNVALSYLETMLDFLGFKQYPEFTEYVMGYPENWTQVEIEP